MINDELVNSRRVYDYVDPVHFLKDQFKLKKSEHPDKSMRFWAQQMGLTKPDLLISLLNGKKQIRPRYFSLLKRVINLDATEETYFLTLIARKSAKTDEDREVFDRILLTLSPGRNITTGFTSDASLFSSWAVMAILFATEISGLRTEASLIQAFNEKLTAAEVKGYIKTLLEKKLLVHEKGELKSAHQIVFSPTDVPTDSVHVYYRQVLDIAKSAISVPLEEREFQFFSFTLDTDDIPAFKQIIRDCRTKLLSRSLHTQNPNAVYQMAMASFPLVKTFEPVMQEIS